MAMLLGEAGSGQLEGRVVGFAVGEDGLVPGGITELP